MVNDLDDFSFVFSCCAWNERKMSDCVELEVAMISNGRLRWFPRASAISIGSLVLLLVSFVLLRHCRDTVFSVSRTLRLVLTVVGIFFIGDASFPARCNQYKTSLHFCHALFV